MTSIERGGMVSSRNRCRRVQFFHFENYLRYESDRSTMTQCTQGLAIKAGRQLSKRKRALISAPKAVCVSSDV